MKCFIVYVAGGSIMNKGGLTRRFVSSKNVYFFIGRIQQIKFNEIYAIDIKYNKVILVIRKYFLTPV